MRYMDLLTYIPNVLVDINWYAEFRIDIFPFEPKDILMNFNIFKSYEPTERKS